LNIKICSVLVTYKLRTLWIKLNNLFNFYFFSFNIVYLYYELIFVRTPMILSNVIAMLSYSRMSRDTLVIMKTLSEWVVVFYVLNSMKFILKVTEKFSFDIICVITHYTNTYFLKCLVSMISMKYLIVYNNGPEIFWNKLERFIYSVAVATICEFACSYLSYLNMTHHRHNNSFKHLKKKGLLH